MRGLIAGVLGGASKAYGEIADTNIKQRNEMDMRQQLMQAEMEKQLFVDEQKRSRDLRDAPLRAKAEAQAQIDAVNTPGYLESIRKTAQASKVYAPGTGTAAEIAQLNLDSVKEIRDLRRQLADATTDEERGRITRRIKDLSGADNEAGVRETLAQQVAAARALLTDPMAEDAQKNAARNFLARVTSDANAARGGATSATKPAAPVQGERPPLSAFNK